MRALSAIAAGLVLGLAAALPAAACSITNYTPGALRASGDGGTMGSQVGSNTPATLQILLPLLSGINVDVAAPTVIQSGAGYLSAPQTLQVAYTATTLLGINVRTQTYTTTATTFATGLLGAVNMNIVVNNRILNPTGFPAGTYMTQTVITCRP